jgi:Flp pilus assembly protein TadD
MRALANQFIVALLLAVAAVCAPPVNAQERPAWEGYTKSKAQRDADKRLIEEARRVTGGDIKAAAQRAIVLGWKAVGESNPELAIRRFNQAWLLDPENPVIHWGFAISTHIRGDPLPVVERWFAKAEEGLQSEPRLLTDRGRVLDERGDARGALAYFERSLALDPAYIETHVGLSRLHAASGNQELSRKHQAAIEKLKAGK